MPTRCEPPQEAGTERFLFHPDPGESEWTMFRFRYHDRFARTGFG